MIIPGMQFSMSIAIPVFAVSPGSPPGAGMPFFDYIANVIVTFVIAKLVDVFYLCDESFFDLLNYFLIARIIRFIEDIINGSRIVCVFVKFIIIGTPIALFSRYKKV